MCGCICWTWTIYVDTNRSQSIPILRLVPTDTRSCLAGLESIFQLVHLIMTDFKWEADALVRAKKLYAQGHDMTVNSLEGEPL